MRTSDARASVLEQARFGVEAALNPGVAVPADLRLRSYRMGDWNQEADVQAYEESGSRFNAFSTIGAEWSSNDFSGKMTFSQDHYMYDGAMGKATPSTVGTLGKKRVYNPDPYANYDPQTYTFQAGQGSNVETYSYGLFTGFSLTMNHRQAEKSGDILAQAVDLTGTFEPTLSTMAYDAILGHKFYVKTASSYAGLAGAAKLDEAFECTFEYSAVFGLAFPMVDDNISFEFPVHLKPTSMFTIQLMKRALAMGFLTQLRGAQFVYFEVGNVGAQIETGVNKSFKLTVAGQFSAPFDPTDIEPGIKGVTWSFYPCPADDMPGGGAFVLEVVNNVA